MVAWGLLGNIWESLEAITLAIADAAEVRVAVLLGEGKPGAAKKAAYKALFLGIVFSLVITSCLFIAGRSIPTWLTSDVTLQNMIAELVPLFGIGNIVLTMGSMAWTILGAQGRYRLATAIGVAGSWLVTIPLAAIFSIVLRVDLQGQTAAIVIGYMVSGTYQNALLLRSNWPRLSEKVIEDNQDSSTEDGD